MILRMLVILYLGLILFLCHGALGKSFARYAQHKGLDELWVSIVQASLVILGVAIFIFLMTDYLVGCR